MFTSLCCPTAWQCIWMLRPPSSWGCTPRYKCWHEVADHTVICYAAKPAVPTAVQVAVDGLSDECIVVDLGANTVEGSSSLPQLIQPEGAALRAALRCALLQVQALLSCAYAVSAPTILASTACEVQGILGSTLLIPNRGEQLYVADCSQCAGQSTSSCMADPSLPIPALAALQSQALMYKSTSVCHAASASEECSTIA